MGLCSSAQQITYPVPFSEAGFAFMPRHGYLRLIELLCSKIGDIEPNAIGTAEKPSEKRILECRHFVRSLNHLQKKSPRHLTNEDMDSIKDAVLKFRKAIDNFSFHIMGDFNFAPFAENIVGPKLTSSDLRKFRKVFRMFDSLNTGYIQQEDFVRWMQSKNDGLAASIFTKALFHIVPVLEADHLNVVEMVVAVETFLLLDETEIIEVCFRVIQNQYIKNEAEWACNFHDLQKMLKKENDSSIVETDHMIINFIAKFMKRVTDRDPSRCSGGCLYLKDFEELCHDQSARIIIFPLLWFQTKLKGLINGRKYWAKRRKAVEKTRTELNLPTLILRPSPSPSQRKNKRGMLGVIKLENACIDDVPLSGFSDHGEFLEDEEYEDIHKYHDSTSGSRAGTRLGSEARDTSPRFTELPKRRATVNNRKKRRRASVGGAIASSHGTVRRSSTSTIRPNPDSLFKSRSKAPRRHSMDINSEATSIHSEYLGIRPSKSKMTEIQSFQPRVFSHDGTLLLESAANGLSRTTTINSHHSRNRRHSPKKSRKEDLFNSIHSNVSNMSNMSTRRGSTSTNKDSLFKKNRTPRRSIRKPPKIACLESSSKPSRQITRRSSAV
eukprot:TRINITY_DN1943_c0_g2_i2.p1 TRINITY_DN1943_c0_g2~~TRINITY_DN1943_c0_g2_i2.p1  ORF type:complete len:609 (-),score=122.97 TRINITY_DN1943_c0_g2_i2:1378-3204(-)